MQRRTNTGFQSLSLVTHILDNLISLKGFLGFSRLHRAHRDQFRLVLPSAQIQGEKAGSSHSARIALEEDAFHFGNCRGHAVSYTQDKRGRGHHGGVRHVMLLSVLHSQLPQLLLFGEQGANFIFILFP